MKPGMRLKRNTFVSISTTQALPPARRTASPLPAWRVGVRRVDGLPVDAGALVVGVAVEVDRGSGAVVAEALGVVAERAALVVAVRFVRARSGLAEVVDERPPAHPGIAASITARIAIVTVNGRLRSGSGRRGCRSSLDDALI